VVDYASLGKSDAPSGTARELAERLDAVGPPMVAVPVEETLGAREARGSTVGTTQVHSLRLPSFSVSTQIVFGVTTSGSRSATTPARHPRRTWPAPCSQSAPSRNASV
jgi:hypothetical protein